MSIKASVPWFAKIAAKIVLSRLPVPYRVWSKLAIFKHGPMADPAYAIGVFETHWAERAPAVPLDGFVGLEVGPGNSLVSALVASAFGARTTYLVDTGRFADAPLETYREAATLLGERGMCVPDISGAATVEEVLRIVGGVYLDRGVGSLRQLPDASVDFVWSQAVLEHVRRAELAPLMTELHRVLRPGCTSSHRIDLRDHLAEGLNNLRFSDRVWESPLMADSGFYTNRIQLREMVALFERSGFDVSLPRVERWTAPPTGREKLAPRFRTLPDEDLLVRGFNVVLAKASAAAEGSRTPSAAAVGGDQGD
ncbi:MAG: methyltransferase domain-containing protein [Acidimicrobiales bacterium]